jgi:hypothetical protein
MFFAFVAGCDGGSTSGGQGGSARDDAAAATDGPSQAKDTQVKDRFGDSPPVGVTWTLAESGADQDLYVVLWAGNRFVTAGNSGTVPSSTDGLAWSRLDTGIRSNLRSLTFTGSRFVAVSLDGG